MDDFKVTNFILYETTNKNIVVQTEKGIVDIEDDKLKEFIYWLDVRSVASISIEQIKNNFESDYKDVIEFLEHFGLLISKSNMTYNIQKIIIYSNNDEYLSIHKSFFRKSLDIFKNLERIYLNDENFNLENLDDKTLLICFLNPYSKEKALYINNKVRESNAILSMNFSYNNKFYFDNLYSNMWKNPCHRCSIENLETQLRNEKHSTNSNYQSFIDMMYSNHTDFSVGYKLDNRDIFKIIDILWLNLEQICIRPENGILSIKQSYEDINEIIEYDAVEKNLSRDLAIHWEVCDCYG